jgi:lipopolysaccharide-induced tumor necrosis factor-alpha factor
MTNANHWCISKVTNRPPRRQNVHDKQLPFRVFIKAVQSVLAALPSSSPIASHNSPQPQQKQTSSHHKHLQRRTPPPAKPRTTMDRSDYWASSRPQLQDRSGGDTPLTAVSRKPTLVVCPSCGARRLTVCTSHSRDSAPYVPLPTMCVCANDVPSLWAIVFCGLLCAPCVPYVWESFKDVKHSCRGCGVPLALWRKGGGGVEVLVHVDE